MIIEGENGMEVEEVRKGEVGQMIEEEWNNRDGGDGCLIDDGMMNIKANSISQGKINNPATNMFFLQ